MKDDRRYEVENMLGLNDSPKPTVESVPELTELFTDMLIPRSEGVMMPAGDKSGALAFPVDVIPPLVAKRIEDSLERAVSTEVIDEQSYALASEGKQMLEAMRRAQNERVTELRRPYSQTADRISKISKDGLVMLEMAVKEWDTKIAKYLKDQEDKRQAALEAQRKAQAEADRLSKEAEAKRQREIEKLRLEADEAARQAELRAWEATQRQERAAEAVAQAATPEAFDAAAAQFDQGLAVDTAAEAAKIEAARKQAALKELEAAPAVVHYTAPAVVVPPPSTVKGGAKLVDEFTIVDTDMAKLPPEYHKADEAKIIKALEMGIRPTGVTFTNKKVVASSKSRTRGR